MAQIVESPASPDWLHVETLYLQGTPPKEIERLTGVKAGLVSVRATRKGWTSALAKVRQSVKVERVTEDSSEADNPKLTAQSDRTRAALAGVLVRSAEKLAEVSLRSPGHALEVNQDAESLVRNAKTVFGWSEGQSQPSVRINVLSSFQVAPQPEAKPDSQPVIDVTPGPALLPAPPSDTQS